MASQLVEEDVQSVVSSSSMSDIDSLSDADLYPEIVENESGDRENVLMPRGDETTHQSVSHYSPGNDEVSGGTSGCTTLFVSCVQSLQGESIIQRSPRGKKVCELLCCIEEKQQEKCVTDIALTLISRLQACVIQGEKHKLPSTTQGVIWSMFQKIRTSIDLKQAWSLFVTTLKAQEPHLVESELTLQLLMDRLLKKMLKNKADAVKQLSVSNATTVPPLTVREKSAIRYMAGYVAVKLLKRYQKPSIHPQINLKYQIFVRVLQGMCAANQPYTVESLSDYTTMWSELIDRGGLYHISDQVLHLMEEVEMVVRHHLSVHSMQRYIHSTNVHACIADEAMKTDSVLHCWEIIAHSIPPTYEEYSTELLRAVISLWVTVRVHAFAKEWTMNFQRKYKKGLRKSLQLKSSEN